MTRLVNRCGCGETFEDILDLKEHKQFECPDPELGEAWNMPAHTITGP